MLRTPGTGGKFDAHPVGVSARKGILCTLAALHNETIQTVIYRATVLCRGVCREPPDFLMINELRSLTVLKDPNIEVTPHSPGRLVL